ncbi:MAG: hypothetical protein H6613_09005 [Ignavibacteriales bacterium]|nr:hypothetical protein [Ignavibacteriota bacterium]MCB9248663.1 hypothetical protein [Ignavibacteriales bacterium]
MEIIKFINDKLVYCVTAKSFADGIVDAHKTLNKQIPVKHNRNYFGIAYMNPKYEIIYKAAVEESSPE